MKDYCVYEHVFPDGKKYIGLSVNPEKRWKSDGSGYISNRPMWKAIQKYGWENIKHNILKSNLSRYEAAKIEKEFIEKYDLTRTGYNQRPGGALTKSLYSEHVMKMIQAMKRYSWLNSQFIDCAKRMLELADDEAWAYQVNLIDYVIREECDGFKNGIRARLGDSMYEVCDWFYFFAHWVIEPEVDIRTIKSGAVLERELYFDSLKGAF